MPTQSPELRPTFGRVGDVVFAPLGDRVVFLAPPGYAKLFTLFGGRPAADGVRWTFDQDRALRLVERLCEYAPQRRA